jgi:hypothetical protein
MSKIKDLVNRLNDGDWDDISNIFSDNIRLFLSSVKRAGLLSTIDLDNISRHNEELINEIMLFILNNDPSYLNTIVKDNLTDVEVRADGYYLKLADLEELSEFFKDDSWSREYNDREVVKSVLGEDWWEPYSDTIYDVYDEIVNVLTDKNKTLLAERIIGIMGNEELSIEEYNTVLFNDMSDDDGMFIITESNVMSVINDPDAMNKLFEGGLNDLKYQLKNLGDNAYNNAYNDEVYSEVFDELSTHFDGKHEWQTKNLENNRTLHIPYIKIRNLNADVTNFLEAFKGYTDTLFYYSSYTEMMKHYMDNDGEFLRISVPDYPDSSKVDDYINDGFPDYLY